MARIVDTSESRGTANQGWLYSRHTFSFAGYHNPERMGFGLLRVINDDVVEASMGFGTHPHENMEIISIPLTGSLRHKDSMGNQHVIRAGEIQVMSAGTGIEHSEYNDSDDDEVNFLQIWVIPKELDIQPRYDQREIDAGYSNNEFQPVVAPMGTEGVVNINQDAYFSIANIDADTTIVYKKSDSLNGVYFFLIKGKLNIGNNSLSERDGLGITEEENIEISSQERSSLLCMEVPMKL
jgi:redox-sensitive bicupin YhaK (pirin superfamily)